MRPIPIQPEPHQESVWDYPRPARLEDTAKHLIVICNQITIAETTGGKTGARNQPSTKLLFSRRRRPMPVPRAQPPTGNL